ncbi:MAG: DUF2905 domain-containing protein [Anaerolineae bacterium]
MELSSLGKMIVLVGMSLVIVGGLLWLLGRTGLPVGRLPGDIHIERDGFSCYIPLATMIVLSIVLTILLNVIIRLLAR